VTDELLTFEGFVAAASGASSIVAEVAVGSVFVSLYTAVELIFVDGAFNSSGFSSGIGCVFRDKGVRSGRSGLPNDFWLGRVVVSGASMLKPPETAATAALAWGAVASALLSRVLDSDVGSVRAPDSELLRVLTLVCTLFELLRVRGVPPIRLTGLVAPFSPAVSEDASAAAVAAAAASASAAAC
jgi:hypothetical protein